MTTQTLTVIPFDPQAASAEARLAVARMIVAAHRFAYPEDPPLVPAREAVFLSHLTPDEAMRQFVVWDGPEVLGWARLEYGLKENLHAAHARLVVHPDHRRRGLGRELARAVEVAAREEGRRLVTFGTTDKVPAGEAFARLFGAEPALPMRQSQLLLDEVPGELLEGWTARPDGDPYRLHVWTRIPDSFLTRAADMMMVMNTAPRGDLDVEDWTVTPEMVRSWEAMIEEGGEVRFCMTVEDTRTGELVGLSETFWTPERASLVFQGATAVRPSARGQGLGKWMKAAMIRHLRQHAPGARFVRTNNADENAAMLGINVAMGFTPWGTFTEWQRRLEPGHLEPGADGS